MTTDLDLDAVRGILAPLDLAPLFLVVGGDHLHGVAGPESAVLVRGVHRTALTATLGPGRRAPNLEIELLDQGIDIRLLSEDLDRTARRIARCDGNLLEEIHSPFVLTGQEAVAELRPLAQRYVTRQIARHYRALARAALWKLEGEKTKRGRPIRALFRAVLAGHHVLRTGEIVPDLSRLAEIHGIGYLGEILPARGGADWVGEPARAGFLLGEAYEWMERVEEAAESSCLPESAPDRGPLEAWFNARREGAA